MKKLTAVAITTNLPRTIAIKSLPVFIACCMRTKLISEYFAGQRAAQHHKALSFKSCTYALLLSVIAQTADGSNLALCQSQLLYCILYERSVSRVTIVLSHLHSSFTSCFSHTHVEQTLCQLLTPFKDQQLVSLCVTMPYCCCLIKILLM